MPLYLSIKTHRYSVKLFFLGLVLELFNRIWLGFVKPSLFIWTLRMFVSYFDLGDLRLNYHIGVLIGLICIAWSGHLLQVALHYGFNYQQYENEWTQLCYIVRIPFDYTEEFEFYVVFIC